MILCRRFHLFELNDQPWWPQYLREKVQDCLTLAWTFRIPIIQRQSPADLVAATLADVLGPRVTDFVYVDFASGAGGPTPYIERELNKRIRDNARNDSNRDSRLRRRQLEGNQKEDREQQKPVKFVLTDLRPHLAAWTAACKKSSNLSFVAKPVDAANAPSRDLLFSNASVAVPDAPPVQTNTSTGTTTPPKVMRLFNLAFHHFDDDLAERILRNTVENGDSFGIFELQSRTPSSLLTVTLLGPLLGLISPIFFWHSPIQLFFTYMLPLIPFCIVFDGYISSLRTRTPDEVVALLRRAKDAAGGGKQGAEAAQKEARNGGGGSDSVRGEPVVDGWRFVSGCEMHTDPIGWMNWIICVKE